jgi:hypothetical protein
MSEVQWPEIGIKQAPAAAARHVAAINPLALVGAWQAKRSCRAAPNTKYEYEGLQRYARQ